MEYKQTEHEVPLLPWKLSHSNTATCWLCSPSVFTEMWSPPDKQEEVRTSNDVPQSTNYKTEQQKCDLPFEKDRTHNKEVYHLNLNNSSSEFDRQSHHSEYTSSVPPTSRLQVGDGSMTMREVHGNPQVNNAFYAMAPNENGKDKVSVAMCKDKKCQKKKKKFVDDGAKGNWFKVTIPCGRKYDKSCLLKSIQSLCTVPFTPVDFHYEKNQARFFVQDAITASALKAVNLRILDEESQRVSIFVSPSIVPYSVQNNFTPEQMETLKVVMGKRYSTFQKYLDLQKFRFDPDLMFHDIDMFLNRRSCMAATVKTILQNFSELSYLNLGNNKLYHLDGLCDMIEKVPQLKKLNLSKNKLMSLSELEKVKGMKLEDLWLEGNPLCSIFSDESDYVRAVREYFPTLLCLDGKELLAPVAMHTEAPQPVQPIMEKYAVFNSIRNLVLQFLQEYYMIYDSRDRHGLLGVYHDEACFSLVIPINASEPGINLDEYFKFSRDMKKLMHPHMQRQLVKHRKHDIVECLRMLPKTQHAYNSLWVDIRLQTETMLCFTVNGMFMEVEGKFPGCVRAFTRTFITTHSKNSSVCIMNDELIVRNANLKEIQSAFPTPLPIVIIPSVPTLSEEQQKMVDIFSIQTGLEPVNSQKCLADNNWNYFKAAEVFTVLQAEGTIPDNFFRMN